jgi:hypothetical protein
MEPRTESGCPFVPRCPHATEICGTTRPALEPTVNGSLVACHHWQEVQRGPAALAATGGADSVSGPITSS